MDKNLTGKYSIVEDLNFYLFSMPLIIIVICLKFPSYLLGRAEDNFEEAKHHVLFSVLINHMAVDTLGK